MLKGCYPKKRRTKAFYNNTLEIIEEVVPSSKAIDIWDFFPDYPNCGEDIQDGEFVFERDYITAKDLNEFANSPELGYFPDAIKRVIEEGPGKNIPMDQVKQSLRICLRFGITLDGLM